MLRLIILIITISYTLMADTALEIAQLAAKAKQPEQALKELGPLLSLGNSSLDQAQIILLPGVHDDPDCLLTQFLLMAREQQRGTKFIVLGESLKALDQSTWELFSEKALEIVVAKNKSQAYSPHSFESDLQNIATKLRQQSGLLSYVRDPGIWTISSFSNISKTFYGWDLNKRQSIYDRNIELVKTLKAVVPGYDRIFVLLGARHVPELEYLISKRLLCPEAKSSKEFFATATTGAIYRYLADKNYAIVFGDKLYKVLDQVIEELGQKKNPCLKLKK